MQIFICRSFLAANSSFLLKEIAMKESICWARHLKLIRITWNATMHNSREQYIELLMPAVEMTPNSPFS